MPSDPESAWTGKHRRQRLGVSRARRMGDYAWSAAFVSYVMRIAGAGPRFPYSAINHSDYIDAAKAMALGQAGGWIVTAERPENYAPQPGDLICVGRGSAHGCVMTTLPAGQFPAHCDIVVRAEPGQICVVGGNVDDAVTMKHVPVTPDGKLATPDGLILDARYPWMVVLQVDYGVPIS